MKQYANGYVSNRVLKLNVGFLLADGPGHIHESAFDVPAVRVSEDVDLAYVRGTIRLSRTKEGVLVQGQLELGVEDECLRCLDPVSCNVPISLEELKPRKSQWERRIDELLRDKDEGDGFETEARLASRQALSDLGVDLWDEEDRFLDRGEVVETMA